MSFWGNGNHFWGKRSRNSTVPIFPYEVTTTWDLHHRIRNPIADLTPYVVRDAVSITLNRKKVIIAGAPGAGKTREAVELIRKLDHDRQSAILLSNEGVQVPTDLPEKVQDAKRVILFIDDFSRRQSDEALTAELTETTATFSDETTRLKKTIEFFEETINLTNFYVIITIRTEELKYLKRVGMDVNVFDAFERIELPPLMRKESEKLIENLVLHFDEMEVDSGAQERLIEVNDGTFSSLVRFFALKHLDHRQRLTLSDAEEFERRLGSLWDDVYFTSNYWGQRVIEALSIFRQCGVEPYDYLVKSLTDIISEGRLRDKHQRIQEGIDLLIQREIVRLSRRKLLSYDLFLEGKGNLENYIDDIADLLLKISRDKKRQVEIYPSLFNLSIRLYHRKKPELTRLLNTRIIEINPNFASTHYDMGVLLAEDGRYEDAEKEYMKILQQYEQEDDAEKMNSEIYRQNKAEAYYNWGKFLYKRRRNERTEEAFKRYEKAEEAFKKAIELFPHYADARYSLGLLYHRLGRYEEAEREYYETVMINPYDVRARNTFGLFLRSQKRTKDAEDQYRHAIRFDPEFPSAHLNLGVLLFQTGRKIEAIKEYRKAIEIDQKNPKAHFNLGIACQAQNLVDEAEKEFRRAIDLNPQYAEAHNSLGVLLYNQGRLDEAEYHYLQAIEANKNLIDARYNLTLLFSSRGESAKAVKHWEAIVNVNE